MKCFYHNDLDGICSAFWVSHYMNDNKAENYIPMEHGKKFPIDSISPNEEVFIVDYSIPPKEMDRLLGITNDIIWIDHHETAINEYLNYRYDLSGIRIIGIAGCLLTFYFFNRKENKRIEEICNSAPWFTKYIADQDVWKFEYGEATKSFNLGFHVESPLDSVWYEMMNNPVLVSTFIENGKIIRQYKKDFNKSVCCNTGHEVFFENYCCFAVNQCFCNTAFFESVWDDKYDIYISYFFDGTLWNYTMFSPKVDVSEIAKKYGGGGHKDAAGFELNDFILCDNS